MTWKQRVTTFPGDDSIVEKFDKLFMAAGAREDLALFCRPSADLKQELFLLSPAAAHLAVAIGGDWADVTDVRSHGWSLLIGSGDPHKFFGLRIPSPGLDGRKP